MMKHKSKKLQCTISSDIQQKQSLSKILKNPFTIVFGICVCLSVSGDLTLAHANMSTKTSTVKLEQTPDYKSLFEKDALSSSLKQAFLSVYSKVNSSQQALLASASPFSTPPVPYVSWGNSNGVGDLTINTDITEDTFTIGGGKKESTGEDITMDGSSLSIENSTVTSTMSKGELYGGYVGTTSGTGTHTALNNAISLNTATLISTGGDNELVGGYIKSNGAGDTASNNSVTVDASTLNASAGSKTNKIYGSRIISNGDSTLSNNAVTISNNSTLNSKSNSIYGASAEGSGDSTFSANTVTIADSTIEGNSNSFYSAYSNSSGSNTFTNNSLEFTGNIALKGTNTLYGVRALTGDTHVLENNSIRVTDATMTGNTTNYIAFLSSYANGSGSEQSIKGNILSIDNSTIQDTPILYIYNSIILGGTSASTNPAITDNLASFKNSTINVGTMQLINGYVSSGGTQTISKNEILVDNTTVNASDGIFLYNGIINGAGERSLIDLDTRIDNGTKLTSKQITLSALIQGNGNQTISQSNVLIDNASILETVGSSGTDSIKVYGGEITGTGDHSISGTTITVDNASSLKGSDTADINISGGVIKGTGAHSITGTNIVVNNGASLETDAGDININGGTIDANRGTGATTVSGSSILVANGSALTSTTGDINIFGGVIENTTGTKSAINNTVVFQNNPVLSAVGGAITIAGSNGSGYLGNRLILNNAVLDLKAVSASSTVENFEHYEFIVPNDIQNGDILLRAGTINLSDTSRNHATLSLTIEGGAALVPGTKITLLGADTITGAFVNVAGNYKQETIKQGIGLQYGITTELNNTARAENHELNITVGEVKRQEQSRVPAEAQIATLAFLNQGGDLVSDLGIQNLRRAAQENLTDEEKTNWATFVASEGGYSKYANEDDSSAKIQGFSLLAGLARRSSIYTNNLTYGAFFE